SVQERVCDARSLRSGGGRLRRPREREPIFGSHPVSFFGALRRALRLRSIERDELIFQPPAVSWLTDFERQFPGSESFQMEFSHQLLVMSYPHFSLAQSPVDTSGTRRAGADDLRNDSREARASRRACPTPPLGHSSTGLEA